MAGKNETFHVKRIKELGNRDASLLDNGLMRVVIADKGGMVSELSTRCESGFINAHWVPHFRANADETFSSKKHGPFWKADLLYNIAGNFPCVPNFGGDHIDEGLAHPPHGFSANGIWKLEGSGTDRDFGAVWALSTMDSPEKALPLRFRKLDVLIKGQSIHYTSLSVENRGKSDAEINIAWHNTIGAPFLQAACRISAIAERWTTAPKGGEFDTTGRLAIGTEFKNLNKAPLRKGGTCDLSKASGMIGYTDFATGVIPRDAPLGWSAVVNPELALVYACFFPGPEAAGSDGIGLRFNDLWMQYGGRPFSPWASFEGGTDLTYCLGTENAVGAFANGLAFSKKQGSLLGAPTTLTIKSASVRTLRYGTLFAPYKDGTLDKGVKKIEGEKKGLAFHSGKKSCLLKADPSFKTLKALEARV